MITKLFPPHFSRLVQRDRLLAALPSDGCWTVLCITAPAGYGKTVLAAQAADKWAQEIIWYQLDEYDNDPGVFLQYLAKALSRYVPDAAQEISSLMGRSDLRTGVRPLAAVIVNGLAQSSVRLAVVLDDYHLITESLVHTLAEEILLHLPPNVRLIIASRNIPQLKLTPLAVKGKVVEVAAKQLQFSEHEVAKLAQVWNWQAESDSVRTLTEMTGGWPVALRLLMGSWTEGMRNAAGDSRRDLYSYLASEVLRRQSPSVQSFLLCSSVLQVMNAPVCDRLMGRQDSQQVLNELEQQQLFVVRLEGEPQTYRYHQLFREFLLDCLGSEALRMHRRAGEITAKLGDLDQAIEHYRAGQDVMQCIPLVIEVGQRALQEGRWQTVARWLDALPASAVTSSPWLVLFRAQVEISQGRLQQAEQWLNQAAHMLTTTGDARAMLTIRILRARILRSWGRVEECLGILDEAADLAPQVLLHFDYWLEKSLALFFLGKFTESAEIIYQALEQLGDCTRGYSAACLFEGLGNVYYMLGQYHDALTYYDKAKSAAPGSVLPSYYVQDSISVIYQDWGELDRAYEYAQQCVQVKEKLGLVEALPSAYIQLAGILGGRGDLDGEERWHCKAAELEEQNKGEKYYQALNYAFWGKALTLQGRWVEAEIKVQQALAYARHLPGFVSGVCCEVGAAIYLHMGRMQEGQALTQKAVEILVGGQFKKAIAHAYALKAICDLANGDREQAVEAVKQFLYRAAEIGLVNSQLGFEHLFDPLLGLALEEGTEVAFVQRLLVQRSKAAIPLLAAAAAHQNSQVRLRSIAPLTQITDPQARQILHALCSDPDPIVRSTAYRIEGPTPIVTKHCTPNSILLRGLGPIHISFNGTSVDDVKWRSLKARDLLVYLVYAGEPVSKEKIIADLWPESGRSGSFHTVLYYLRQTLKQIGAKENLVQYVNGRYSLTAGSFFADWLQFEALINKAMDQETLTEQGVQWLEDATAIYRGDLLQELDYPWLAEGAERYRQLWVRARLQLAHHYIQEKQHSKALTHVQTVSRADPLLEEAYCLAMLAYFALGDGPSIKRQYQSLQRVLEKELGVKPSSETETLYNHLCDRC